MGGIGKTELALQYALKHLKLQDYPGGVCWLRSREDIGLQIVQFAREKLGMMPPDDRELMAQVEWCWVNWQKATTLLVFDDVQAYAVIKPFLPKHRDQFRVVLTTRKYLDGSVQPFEIQVLSEVASLELLRRLVSDGRIDQDIATAKQVCEWLGYLPLGLELVGRYLARKKGCSVAKLWERLQEQKLAAKALLEAESGMTASLGVTAAFELSWQELNADAQRLAALLSLFALADILWSLVQQCLPETDQEELEDLRDEQLVNLSLLNYVGEDCYLLHQLLREFFAVKRSQMPEDEEMKRSFYPVVIAGAEKAINNPEQSLLKETDEIMPHLKAAIMQLEMLGYRNHLVGCIFWLANLYEAQGRYNEADPLYVQIVEIMRHQPDADSPYLATVLNNLALLYYSQGRFAEAEPLNIEALQIRRRRLGNAHPAVATSLNNLALLYIAQGRYNEAEPLHFQALEIRQNNLGNDHPDVGNSLDNLGHLYSLQERYNEAELLHLQALEICRRQLGEDHPRVATIISNLAYLYDLQERYDEAEPMHLQALEIRKRQLGEDHPRVATIISNLAYLYDLQERYDEAEPMHLQALEIRKRQLGEDHPQVAFSYNNLAHLYKLQGRYAEAEPLYLQSLVVLMERLGSDHPKFQGIWQSFLSFLEKVIEENQTGELSDDWRTRSLLQQLQNKES
ncbi:MAG: tetratricopeptide repeat protein [Phormidium tanganyikae FI6-MK23]|nr:tetratricopeptide repeat protein [Phormidium tanganyikae FI6-MK23]